MVKKLLLFFIYSLFFTLAIIYFTPKQNIYFLAEQELKKHSVIVSLESLDDNGFSLSISDASVSIKSIQSANIEKTDITLLGLYNAVNIKNITLSSTAKSFVPLKIQSVDIVYSILNPLNIVAHGEGEFGEVDATINIQTRELSVVLKPSKKMSKNYKNTLRNLKKSDNGEFVYDKTF